ncbi:DUF397 domain-containing protein [Streptomyces sp. NPDC020845]|uniref:DUF397 domain-containing protein n=1 Tax=Streptomyces sp. NPDC020845 TaxID=3365096 RepID=UPI0037BC7C89
MPTPHWRKSSFSGEGNNCLNVASAVDGTIRLRESEAPDTVLTTTPTHLGHFIRAAKAGQFDHLTP